MAGYISCGRKKILRQELISWGRREYILGQVILSGTDLLEKTNLFTGVELTLHSIARAKISVTCSEGVTAYCQTPTELTLFSLDINNNNNDNKVNSVGVSLGRGPQVPC